LTYSYQKAFQPTIPGSQGWVPENVTMIFIQFRAAFTGGVTPPRL